MNWARIRAFPWVDTRARFVAGTPRGGALLDLGASDGETLGHIAELRPDLHFFAADLEGAPEKYPTGCQFARVNLETDRLPWKDGSLDSITCMQLVEHLRDCTLLESEVARLLKPGGRVFIETPHPKTMMLSSPGGSAAGTFTMNFWDDLTHTRVVPMGAMAKRLRRAGLEIVSSGISRNWFFAASYPLFCLMPASRQKFTARIHWLGWSAYRASECQPTKVHGSHSLARVVRLSCGEKTVSQPGPEASWRANLSAACMLDGFALPCPAMS